MTAVKLRNSIKITVPQITDLLQMAEKTNWGEKNLAHNSFEDSRIFNKSLSYKTQE